MHEDLVAALMNGLLQEQVEIDMIKLSAPAFAGMDNRLMSFQLVERGLTDAAMFTADGQVVQRVGDSLQAADPGRAWQLPPSHQPDA